MGLCAVSPRQSGPWGWDIPGPPGHFLRGEQKGRAGMYVPAQPESTQAHGDYPCKTTE